MNLPFRSPTAQRIVEKMEIEEPTVNDLKRLKQAWSQQTDQVRQGKKSLQKILEQKQGEIYQNELDDLTDYYFGSEYWINKIPLNLDTKLLKFFTAQFDHKFIVQMKALNLYRAIKKPPGAEVDEKQIQLALRVLLAIPFDWQINASFLKIFEHIDKSLSIIDWIQKYNSLTVLAHLLRLDIRFEQICFILSLFIKHIKLFTKFSKTLEEKEEHMDNELSYNINQKIVKFLDVCFFRISQYQSTSVMIQVLSCLSKTFQQLPALRFSLQNFYLDENKIEPQYFQLQDEVAEKLYKTNILSRLQCLYNFHSGWRTDQAFEIINMMVMQIPVQQFQMYVIPQVTHDLTYLTDSYVKGKIQALTTLIVKFFYQNKSNQDSQSIFRHLFLESQIFDQVINLVEKKLESMCFVQYLVPKNEKQVEEKMNLFYMTVLALQIIIHCDLFKQSNYETSYKRSTLLMKKVHKYCWFNTWQKQIIDILMSEMTKREENQQPMQSFHENQHRQYDI